jgi:hypothetical protein
MSERERALEARVRELEEQLAAAAPFGAEAFDTPDPPFDVPAALPYDPPAPAPTRAAWGMAGTFFALAAFVMLYRVVIDQGLSQTGLMFLGLPTVIGATLALTPAPTSAVGRAARAVTLALALACVLLQEGAICVLMAAPLYYAVALTTAALVDFYRTKGPSAPASVGLVLLVLASAEGVTPALTLPAEEVVLAQRLVEATPDEVRAALARTPVFDQPLPTFLRLGFPRPTRTAGSGLERGDRRSIQFGGDAPQPGVLELEVVESEGDYVIFEAKADRSHIGRWLTWQTATVRWEPVREGETRVTWEVRFRRELAPGWYFSPWERYAMGLAADYLIRTVATP